MKSNKGRRVEIAISRYFLVPALISKPPGHSWKCLQFLVIFLYTHKIVRPACRVAAQEALRIKACQLNEKTRKNTVKTFGAQIVIFNINKHTKTQNHDNSC